MQKMVQKCCSFCNDLWLGSEDTWSLSWKLGIRGPVEPLEVDMTRELFVNIYEDFHTKKLKG